MTDRASLCSMVTDDGGCSDAGVRLLSRYEVEQLLRVSRVQLWRLVKAGELPVIRIDNRPRFLAQDVAAFIDSRRQVGGKA
jgi:predicted DNA-binding transcriptional regulator AlpA